MVFFRDSDLGLVSDPDFGLVRVPYLGLVRDPVFGLIWKPALGLVRDRVLVLVCWRSKRGLDLYMLWFRFFKKNSNQLFFHYKGWVSK